MSESIEIAVRDDGAIDEATIRAALDLAVENRAVDEIFTAAIRADAQRLYERRQGLLAAANRMARLVVECNAAIGQIDLVENPFVRQTPMMLGGREATKCERGQYRSLGAARDRGTLPDRITEVEHHGGEVASATVATQISLMGDFNVPREALVSACTEATGLSMNKVMARAGYLAAGGRSAGYLAGRKGGVVGWPKATKVAAAASVDPRTLPLAPREKRNRRGALWLVRERKLSGGRWDEVYSRHRRLLDEIQRVAPNADPRYNDLYAHLYAVEAFLGRQLRKGRQAG